MKTFATTALFAAMLMASTAAMAQTGEQDPACPTGQARNTDQECVPTDANGGVSPQTTPGPDTSSITTDNTEMDADGDEMKKDEMSSDTAMQKQDPACPTGQARNTDQECVPTDANGGVSPQTTPGPDTSSVTTTN